MKSKLSQILLVVAFALLASIGVFRKGYFSMHDDLQVMRVMQMVNCQEEGQVPCRVAKDMGFGWGQPMFSYYSSFPYYLGTIVYSLGFSYLDTVKVLFFLSFLIAATGVYALCSLFFDYRISLIASFISLMAPYRLVDVYVRGALSEVMAISILPLILYLMYRLFESGSKLTGILYAFAVFAFLTSHLPSILMASMFLIVFFLILVYRFKNKNIAKVLLFSFLGVALSSYFLLPVILERNLINTSGLYIDYYNYQIHFVSLAQLFVKSIWGYGPSRIDDQDNLSFHLGWVYIISLVFYALQFIKRIIKKEKIDFLEIFFLASFIMTVFLTHAKSNFIYQLVPVLSSIQFPWRFLGPASVFGILVVARFLSFLPLNMAILIGIFTLITNFSNLRFEKYYPEETDSSKLNGASFEIQSRSAISDYLPISSPKVPTSRAPYFPNVVHGIADFDYSDRRGNYYSTEVNIYSDNATIWLPFTYFPEMELFLDRSPIKIPYKVVGDYGQIEITLPKGKHLIQVFQRETKTRQIANIITLASIVVIFYILLKNKNEKK